MSTAGALARRIWRDSVFRSLPLWLALTLLTADVLALLLVFPTARRDAAALPEVQLLLVLWLPVAGFLMLARLRTRAHRLELALPIPARELWLTHAAAVALTALIVLAGGFGVLALIRLLLTRLDLGSDPMMQLAALVPPLVAATLLGSLFAQRLRPESFKPAGGPRLWLALIAGLTAIPAAVLLLGSRPLLATGLFLLLAAALLRNTWTALPTALELTPVAEAAAGPEPHSAAPLAPGAPVGRPALARILFVLLHDVPPWRQITPWVLYFFICLVGFFLAGGFAPWVELDESRLLNLPLGTYMLFTGAGMLTYHLHRLDPLPLSRRAVFAALVLPSLVIFCLGWGAGRLVSWAGADMRQAVDYRLRGEEQWVQVAPQHMGIAIDGEVPMLTAPWGEEHPAWHRPLFPGSRVLLYSPFNTPEPASARFEALMTSRAIETVLGRSVPAAEILGRYFEVENDRVVGLRGDGLTLADDYPALTPPAPVAGTPVFLALILAPWLLLLALFTRTFRATASIRAIRWFYWAVLIVLLAALLGQVVAAILRLYNPAVGYGLLAVASDRLAANPTTATATWLVGLALIGGAYAVAQASFHRAELPASPIQCALVDWGKGG